MSERRVTKQMERQMKVALVAIEALVGDDFMEDLFMSESRLRGRSREMFRRLSLIYSYSHSAIPEHSCYHVHDNWRALAQEHVQEFSGRAKFAGRALVEAARGK